MVLKECVEGGGEGRGELYRRKRTVSNSEIDWKIGVGRNIPVGIDPFYDFTIHLSAFRHCATALSLSLSLSLCIAPMERTIEWDRSSKIEGSNYIYIYIYIYIVVVHLVIRVARANCANLFIRSASLLMRSDGYLIGNRSIYVFITKGGALIFKTLSLIVPHSSSRFEYR